MAKNTAPIMAAVNASPAPKPKTKGKNGEGRRYACQRAVIFERVMLLNHQSLIQRVLEAVGMSSRA